MNLILLFEADRIAISQERFMVSDRRHQHLMAVLKVEVGQQIRVGLWDGPTGIGTVRRITPSSTELDVQWHEHQPKPSPVHLILAIPRPKTLKKLLPEVVTLGIRRLTLLRSWRVAQPYLSSPMLQPEQQQPLIADGLMQAGCTRPPSIDIALRFRPFVEDVAAALPHLKWIAHPHAATPLGAMRPGNLPVVMAIGPEGGWLPYEVEAFEAAGFVSVNMGGRILRVETACTALLANLQLLRNLQAASA
ncbi:MAG: RsmE family RNA methyltransferase [Myxococcota bacterium]